MIQYDSFFFTNTQISVLFKMNISMLPAPCSRFFLRKI